MPSPTAVPIELSREEREVLEGWTRRRIQEELFERAINRLPDIYRDVFVSLVVKAPRPAAKVR